MCQREYLISRIFKLLLVLLKRAYIPRIAVSHKCFMVSGILVANLRVLLFTCDAGRRRGRCIAEFVCRYVEC